jgi:hypothetical protein
MREEDLIKIWQSSPNRERVKFERAHLMVEVQASVGRVHGMIKYGNRRAMIAPLIIVAVFTFYIYIIPFTLSKIASGLAVLFAVNTFLRFRKAKKNEPKDFTGTYLEYLYKAKSFLLNRKQLADTGVYWAIIPAIVLCILFFLGFMESPLFTTTTIIALCVGCLVIGVLLFILSKWWVKMAVTPNLKKIDELISALEEEESQSKESSSEH